MKLIKLGLLITLLTLVTVFNAGTVICEAATPKIAAGTLYTAILKGDGTLWAWGENNYGQLGDGTVVDRRSPGRVLCTRTVG